MTCPFLRINHQYHDHDNSLMSCLATRFNLTNYILSRLRYILEYIRLIDVLILNMDYYQMGFTDMIKISLRAVNRSFHELIKFAYDAILPIPLNDADFNEAESSFENPYITSICTCRQ